MRFSRAFHVLVENFKTVFKLFAYELVVSTIMFSIAFLISSLTLGPIVGDVAFKNVGTLLREFFTALTTGDTAYLAGFQAQFSEALSAMHAVIASHVGSLTGWMILLLVVYVLTRFFNGLGLFTASGMINDKMNSRMNTKFSVSFFENLAKSSLYEVVYVPLAFAYDALSALAVWFLFFYVLSFCPLVVTLALSMGAIVCLQALKLTFTSAWLPATLKGSKMRTAMKRSFGAKKSSSLFGSYVVSGYTIVIVNVVTALTTFGGALLVTIPMSYLFISSLQLVHYYEDEGEKYFITETSFGGADLTK